MEVPPSCTFTALLNLDAEVSEYLQALVQLHGVLVPTEEVSMRVWACPGALAFHRLQLCQLFQGKLQGGNRWQMWR